MKKLDKKDEKYFDTEKLKKSEEEANNWIEAFLNEL